MWYQTNERVSSRFVISTKKVRGKRILAALSAEPSIRNSLSTTYPSRWRHASPTRGFINPQHRAQLGRDTDTCDKPHLSRAGPSSFASLRHSIHIHPSELSLSTATRRTTSSTSSRQQKTAAMAFVPVCVQCGTRSNPCRCKVVGPTLGFVAFVVAGVIEWPLGAAVYLFRHRKGRRIMAHPATVVYPRVTRAIPI